VNETKAVQVPRTVGKWVAYQSTRLQPRIVTMRVPLGGVYTAPVLTAPPVIPASPRPTAAPPAQKSVIGGTQVQRQSTDKPKSSESERAPIRAVPADEQKPT